MGAGFRRSDLWIALGGGAVGAAASLVWGYPSAAELALAVGLGLLLGLGRVAPTPTWILASGVMLAAAAADTAPGGDTFALVILLGAHGFVAGRFDGRWMGIAGVVVLGGASVWAAVLVGDSPAPYLFIPVAGWGAGRGLRERALVADELAERARELEAEREAYAALSVRYERARIASELHDIVAHAISVMVVQATAGQRLAPHDPEATAETFEAIAGAARQAEHEMGLLVELLADERATGADADIALVEDLVARASGSGLDVTLVLGGDRSGVAPEAARLAYRVVQEGLTNALRYAAGAPVTVRVSGDSAALAVDVVNGPVRGEPSLAGVGTGNGLRGLRERVEAAGGTLDAGPEGGGWRLGARLPRVPGRPLPVAQPTGR
ncbi:MAG TPA: histidine kinase [Miltoncostaeaceae bacterium]|nr:histidine kinase [Miltoncostaeaceae bacterium]